MKRVIVFVFLLVSVAARATNYYVSLDGGHVTPFTNWNDAATSVNDVVLIARGSAVNNIYVSNGVYYMTNTLHMTYCKMYSIYGPSTTVLDGNFPAYSNRVIQMYNNSLLSGFVIRNASNGASADTLAAGVHLEYSTIENCLIYSNYTRGDSVDYVGGGIGMMGGTMRNCTVVNNRGKNPGGFGYASGPTKVENCIIQSNYTHGGVVSNWGWASANGGLTVNNTCTWPAIPTNGSSCFTNDPRFVDPVHANWRLSADSPCVNAGTNQTWMTNAYDLDGRTRVRYGTVDMGVYERIHEGSIYIVK